MPRDPREEIGEPLRGRDTNPEEVKDSTPGYGAMLHLVEQFAGMLRDKEQRSEEQITRNWKSGQSKPKHPGSPI